MKYHYTLKNRTKNNPNEIIIFIDISSKYTASFSYTKGKTKKSRMVNFLKDLLDDIAEAITMKTGVVVHNAKITDTKNGIKINTSTVTPELYKLVIKRVFQSLNNGKNLNYSAVANIISHEIEKFSFRWNVTSLNIKHIINYALNNSLKVEFLGANEVMIGQGAYAEIFDSTSTFRLSILGAKTCKNKIRSSNFLSRIGLPTIDMKVVTKSDFKDKILKLDISSLAPLVVKPSDQDRGVGITTNIYLKSDLLSAIEASFSHSALAIIQKQIEGDTFRINTFCGEVVSVIQRSKAKIIGDGMSQISTLVDNYLQSIEYKEKCERWGKDLISRDAALSLILRQGYQESVILEKGVQLSMSQTHNANSGASSIDVPVEKLDPSFLEVSRLITKSLRLDFLGVDWIASDLRSHWQVSGAKILELNTQPQIGERGDGKTYEGIMRNFKLKNLSVIEVCIYDVLNLVDLEALVRRVIKDQNMNKTGIFVWMDGIVYIYNGEMSEYIRCVREQFEIICKSRYDCYGSILVFNEKLKASTGEVERLWRFG